MRSVSHPCPLVSWFSSGDVLPTGRSVLEIAVTLRLLLAMFGGGLKPFFVSPQYY